MVRFHQRLSVVMVASIVLIPIAGSNVNSAHFLTLRGSVESGGTGLEGYEVSLLASFVGSGGGTEILGRDTTGPFGDFEIKYRLPAWRHPSSCFARKVAWPCWPARSVRRRFPAR